MGCLALIKKLIIESVNRGMNLLTLINSLLANIYYSTTLSNHAAIRFKRFVSQINRNMCN
jgi:hypothetical protein